MELEQAQLLVKANEMVDLVNRYSRATNGVNKNDMVEKEGPSNLCNSVDSTRRVRIGSKMVMLKSVGRESIFR